MLYTESRPKHHGASSKDRRVIQPPVVCRPKAYWLFAQQLPHLSTTEGLWKAASALSMHALEQCELQEVDQRFEALAAQVRRGARSGRQLATLTHLHHVLFDLEGFSGNFDDYTLPSNSYLPAVLESRRGLPVILALIYKVVAERVGLHVEGINSPGHFLTRIQVDGKWHLIDPFFHGQLLTPDEALARVSELTSRQVSGIDRYLPPATHPQWLARILNNLLNVFETKGLQNDQAAMLELQKLLWEVG